LTQPSAASATLSSLTQPNPPQCRAGLHRIIDQESIIAQHGADTVDAEVRNPLDGIFRDGRINCVLFFAESLQAETRTPSADMLRIDHAALLNTYAPVLALTKLTRFVEAVAKPWITALLGCKAFPC